MKKISKMIFVVLVMSILMSICVLPALNVQADAQSVIGGINAQEPNSTQVSGLQTMASKIIGIIQVASAVAAVILIAVFGFKFIMGSAQEKSDYMKSFIPLIVGVVVVFAASSIAKLIFSVAGT